MKRLVLDAGALIEYIVLRSPHRRRVARLLDGALAGELELHVSAVTLSEILYVASRVYQAAGVDEPNEEALDFVEWIESRARVVDVSGDLAVRSGELKKRLGIALPDCYVIATAEAVGATPVFRGLEREMEPVLSDLRELGVKFLEEIE